ncbi:class I SAM-dependent methyltransferase [Butyrivibrio sp. YAB3001]|uniref:class I SAM-dependent methyltransferase n=1 Tax=Butyrivibrio sp. YAB3001 TaxID=1520812 RepID=UPI0008F65C78|nr:class I SAM-dependent methyltransferase [Butyrivibrio sp. YAB3001]SFB94844.1 Methyltransferase domain-containing protein [Butyrivibrio sp. YAB3001]
MQQLTVILIASEYEKESMLSAESIILHEKEVEISIIILDSSYRSELSKFASDHNFGYVYQENADESIGKTLNEIVSFFNVETDLCIYFGGYFDTLNALYKFESALSYDGIGVVGGKSNLFKGMQLFEQAKSYEEMRSCAENNNEKLCLDRNNGGFPFGIGDSVSKRVLGVDSDVVVISHKVIGEIGDFDEEYDTFDATFRDYMIRIIMQDWRIGVVDDALFWGIHKSEKASNSDKKLFSKKHNLDFPDYDPDENIIDFINESHDAAFNILELGCGCGKNLLEISNRYPNCKIYGMEKNTAKAKVASQFAGVKIAENGYADLNYERAFFKYIILGDILESIDDCKGYLEYIQPYLAEGGRVIASFDNAQHIAYLNQLFGHEGSNEEVEDDSSAIKNRFTLEKIQDLFKSADYYLGDIRFSISSISSGDREIIDKLRLIYPETEDLLFEADKYYVSASPSYSIMLPQNTVNAISDVSYNGLNIYMYISDVLILFESEEEVMRDSEQSSRRIEIKVDGDQDEAKHYIEILLNELTSSDVLIANVAGRKIMNGEEYLSVLDPYIDAIKGLDFLVIDMSGQTEEGEYPCHTNNVHFCPTNTILCAYGIDSIDYDNLEKFMEDNIFHVIEARLNRRLFPAQKTNLVNIVYHALSIRKAFIAFYHEIIERVRPKVIFYSHGGNSKICFLYELAQQNNIPCIEIDHGVITYQVCYPQSVRHADELVVYSDVLEKESRTHGADNVVAIGKPGIIEKKANYKSTPGNMILICVVSSAETGVFEIAARLSENLTKDKYVVLYKKHLVERFDEAELEKYPNLTVIGGEVEINSLYERCQIVIGHRSTALLEALVYEKIKVILIGNSNDYRIGGKYGHFGYMIDNEEMVYAGSLSDVISEIKCYRKGRTYRPKGELFWKKNADKNFRELISKHLKKQRG